MRLAIVNYEWDARVPTPAAWFDHERALTGWAGAVRASGCDPVVVCQRFGARADLARDEVTYRFRPDAGKPQPGLTFAGADPVHASAARVRPDIVHVCSAWHPALLRRLRAKLSARTAIVVQDRGGTDPTRVPPARLATIRRGLADADLLIVSSHGRAALWRESGGAPADLEIADLIEASTTFTPMARDEARRLTRVDGTPALLWVGRPTAGADPLTVLRGFALAAARLPTSRLTMVFAGDVPRAVRAEITRTASLEPRVRLAGPVPHAALRAFYSAADFVVLGSREEESSEPVVEAMACGAVPVVADVPSFRAVTGSERVGALWKPGQPRAFADALARAAARPPASEREAARLRFETHFSWRAIAWRATQLYRAALARRR
jgi:glycosyltransferase involved in cell wall biosynthesis